MSNRGISVLVFDRDAFWLEAAKTVLEDEGYSVTAENEAFENCFCKAEQDGCLVAVINLQNLQSPTNELRKFTKQFPAVTIIGVQDEIDPRLDEFLWYPNQLVQRSFGTKRDHLVTSLPDIVAHELDRRGMVPKDMEITLPDDTGDQLRCIAQRWSGMTAELGRNLSSQILEQELRIVVSQMFDGGPGRDPIARSIRLETFAIEGGQSGSVMFTVTPSVLLDETQAKSALLKFAPKQEVTKESKNYDKFVEWFLTTDQAVRKIAHAEGNYFAGLLYSYPRDKSGGYEKYTDYVRHSSTEECQKVISLMFSKDNLRWYSVDGSPHVPKDIQRFETYYVGHVLNVATKHEMRVKHFGKLLQEVASLERRTKASIWECTESRITIPRLQISIPNPIAFIDQPHIERIRFSVIHGDLRGQNILVDRTGRSLLLDFFYTGFGDICRDFVELELSIRHDLLCSRGLADEERLVGTNSDKVGFEGLKKLLRLEKGLVHATVFGREVKDPLLSEEGPLKKAFELICHIRRCAREYSSSTPRLYYMSLAVSALKALKYFYPIDVKLYRLLISGLYIDLLSSGDIK